MANRISIRWKMWHGAGQAGQVREIAEMSAILGLSRPLLTDGDGGLVVRTEKRPC